MKVVLAEKPSVARELASFLGASTRREGYFEGKGYQVTWALGHLATLKEPQDYDPAWKKWSLASLPMVPERFGLKVIDDGGAKKQFAVIKRLLRDADEVIAATDAGREGELIFRYIQELAGARSKPARRLWLSSLTEAAIRDAFARLRPLDDYDDLYHAARCRSEADWVVGLNATRYYTVRFRSGGQLWSVGRVQTPVLALIARRDDEIRVFRPQPFWELLTTYRDTTFKFVGDRFPKQEEAQTLLDRVVGQSFTIEGVDRKPERVPPPQLYDLTDLQRDLNRRFGFSADATLKAAQLLYEAKLISYPRTDSRYIGNDLKGKLGGILQNLSGYKPTEIGRLDLTKLPFTGRIVDNAKVGDHHAILPTGKLPTDKALGGPAGKVFEAIVTRTIAAFYPTCVKEVTTVTGSSAGVKFRARGVRIVEPGWTVLYPRKADPARAADDDQQDLPAFTVGETGPHEPTVREGRTTPPKPYTEGALLGAMETAGKLVEDEALRDALKERGLGTPATRASIIETLLTRGYIARDKKTLTATDLGRFLVAVIQDRGLKSAELTGDWEARLREVERGRLDPAQFMGEIVAYTRAVIQAPTDAVDPNQLGPCPRCGKPVIEGKRAYGCSAWKAGCPFVLERAVDGRDLAADDVRHLLQHRVLFPTAGTPGRSLLQLLDSGDLVPIPIPEGKPGPSGGRPDRRSPLGRKTPVKATRPKAPPPGPSGDKPEPAQAAGFAEVNVGTCPLCGSAVVEGDRAFGCSGWQAGCKFRIWKVIAGKKVSMRQAQALLAKGATTVLKGFASKAGRKFDARLKLDGGEVKFDFTKG